MWPRALDFGANFGTEFVTVLGANSGTKFVTDLGTNSGANFVTVVFGTNLGIDGFDTNFDDFALAA